VSGVPAPGISHHHDFPYCGYKAVKSGLDLSGLYYSIRPL
jgi:hypothetical protein